MELILERDRLPEPVLPVLLALALYLALVATAAGILGSWPAPWLLLPGLLSGGLVLALRGRGALQIVAAAAPVGLVVLLVSLWPTAAMGMEVLYNRLCDASEACNAYHYLRFSLSMTPEMEVLCAGWGTALSSLVLGVLAAAGALNRGMALALFLAVGAGEIYFGVTPGPGATVLFGAVVALIVVWGQALSPAAALRRGAGCLALGLLVVLAVQLTAPGVNQPLEDWSEAVRDRFGVLEQHTAAQVEQRVQQWQESRRESRLDEEMRGEPTGELAPTEDYQRQEEQEDQISRPQVTDWPRILLIALLILLLLTVPFVPFILVDRQRKKALERRADFASEDTARAVQAMFMHIVSWLEAAGLKRGNRLFSACRGDVGSLMDEGYAQAYEAGVAIWQRAAYSSRSPSEEERQQVRQLLETTEQTIWARAGRVERFRLKYVRCLAV